MLVSVTYVADPWSKLWYISVFTFTCLINVLDTIHLLIVEQSKSECLTDFLISDWEKFKMFLIIDDLSSRACPFTGEWFELKVQTRTFGNVKGKLNRNRKKKRQSINWKTGKKEESFENDKSCVTTPSWRMCSGLQRRFLNAKQVDIDEVAVFL